VVTDMGYTYSAEGAAALRADVVSCWMCGIHLHSGQMLADGGTACDDIRWYCTDHRTCTERWTSARRRARAAENVRPESGAAPRRG
jgi:hypothetical protein